jgi:hypothetical protein
MLVFNAVVLSSGILWILTYILVLRRGFLDKTYGIPLLALIINVASELLHSTLFKDDSSVDVSVIWLALDVPILLQAMWYGQRESGMAKGPFLLMIYSGLAASFAGLYCAEVNGMRYISSAFPQNLLMSILFVLMLRKRQDARGQSIYIGLFKMLGTGLAIVAEMLSLQNLPTFYALTFAGILFFDLLYVALVYRKLSSLGIRPWQRL